MKNLVVTEEIWKEGNMYTAYCPELDVASCGRDLEEARNNLIEVIEIQLEETAKLGTLKNFLEDAGYDLNTSHPTLQLDKQVVAFSQLTVPTWRLLMPKISPTNWRIQVKIFENVGCRFIRQKGSHLIYHHPDAKRAVVIPRYDEVPVTVIKNNLRTINLSREEYFRLLAEV